MIKKIATQTPENYISYNKLSITNFMLSRRTNLSTGEQQENKKALPLKSED